MLKDLKHAARMLLKAKVWTIIVLISLALGIGANTALFSAVNGLLVRKLPVPAPDELVRFKWSGDNNMVRSQSSYGGDGILAGLNMRSSFSYSTYQAMRTANQTMTDLAAYASIQSFNVIINNEADLASSLGVSGSYFRVLRLTPLAGRLITEDDDQPSAPPVAVVSEAFWRKRLGSEPAAVGRVITVNNKPVTVVGITPASFTGTMRLGATAPDVMVPLALDPVFNPTQTRLKEPTTWWLLLVGRLKPGVTLEQVQANEAGVFEQAARAGMDEYESSLTAEQRDLSTNKRRGSRVPPLHTMSGSRGNYDLNQDSKNLALYLGVVALLVLLLVCANVANLLISRATSRHREISVRLSMGATRPRLVRQLLTESLLLAVIGGALGVLVGYWSRQLLPFGQTTPIDWRVFAFSGGLSVVTGVLFGLLPAFRATRVDLASDMKESSRSVTASRSWLSRALLVVQVAVSLVLLVGAGLFLRTVSNLRSVNVGFNTSNLLTFDVNPSLNRSDPDLSAQLLRDVQNRLANVPGVRSVAVTRVLPLSGSSSSSNLHTPSQPKESEMYMMSVSPEFLSTMEIPLLTGRGLTERDNKEAPKVAVINETAARKLFAEANPIGQRVGFSKEKNTEYEIVGVSRDTKYYSLREPPPPTFYQNYMQTRLRGGMTMVLRTAGDPSAMVPAVRAAVRDVEPNMPLTDIATEAEQVERGISQDRLVANATTLFGALALLLASIGLFGIMSYSVARRTNEIGIRMALGAQRHQVAGMVLGESLLMVGIGLAAGLGAAVVLARYLGTWIGSKLFQMAMTDVVTIGGAALLLLAVSTLAGFLPARRASKVDPLIALQRQ